MSEYKANVQGFSLTIVTPEVEVANNVDQLVGFITERIKDYNPEKYDGDAAKAKKDRTELNKGADQVKAVRQAIQELNPYKDIVEKLANAEKLIKSGSSALGNIVHAKEAEEQDAKRKLIQSEWDLKKFTLFPLEKIFNEKWLNKSYKMTDISNEMWVIIERTYRDLKALEKMDNPMALKSRYLTDLDLSATMKYAEELKANEKAAENELEHREEREHEEKIEAQKKETLAEIDRYANRAKSSNFAAEALGEEYKAPLKEYTLTVKVTEAQLLGIKSFLNGQGVEFECNLLEF